MKRDTRNVTTYAIIAVVSYLLGSIPFGYILVKVFRKQDIRTTGSGNIGATNVARSGAKGLAIATLILDALKGTIAVQIASYVSFRIWPCVALSDCAPSAQLLALAALMAVAGHMFTPWLGFKGGKGVATAVGAFGALAAPLVFWAFLLFLLVVAITRYVSLGSMVAAVAFPVLVYLSSPYILGVDSGRITFALICATSLLVIAKHHENIRRLLAGTENRLGAKPKIPPPQEMEKQA